MASLVLLLSEESWDVVGSEEEPVGAVGAAVVAVGTGTPRLAAQSARLWPCGISISFESKYVFV
jgi:hypothetical protein